MTRKVFTIETVGLRIDKSEGWLRKLFDVLEGLGYCVDRFILRGNSDRRGSGAHQLNIELTVRTVDARPNIEALLLTLKRSPGVRRCRRSASARKMQASNAGQMYSQNLTEKAPRPVLDVPASEMFP